MLEYYNEKYGTGYRNQREWLVALHDKYKSILAIEEHLGVCVVRHFKRHGISFPNRKFNARKLSPSDVCTIRHLRKCGVQGKHIAPIYRVAKSTIAAIMTGQTWKGGGSMI